jgi:hypothetical protein
MPPKRRRLVVDVPSDHDSDVVVTGSQVSPSRRRSASQRVRGGGTARQSKREPLVPEAFQTLLSEDSKRGWTSGSSDGGDRIAKRRKGKERENEVVEISDGTSKEEEIMPQAAAVEDEDEDEDEESDIDWEDVDLSAKRQFYLVCLTSACCADVCESYEPGRYHEGAGGRITVYRDRKASYIRAHTPRSGGSKSRRPETQDYCGRKAHPTGNP